MLNGLLLRDFSQNTRKSSIRNLLLFRLTRLFPDVLSTPFCETLMEMGVQQLVLVLQ